MTRKLLFSLIGAIILFAWLFLSNAMPNFHKAASTYTPKQAELLQKIQESGLEEGMYMLGQPDPKLSQAEKQAFMESMDGKPWAVLNYHRSNSMSMVMPMIRGILVCFCYLISTVLALSPTEKSKPLKQAVPIFGRGNDWLFLYSLL
ncbi:MAG: hypothetical protein IPH45_20475 [Bacteroidales bacterium]|nr:hypothetical protein [Bacteroidales bacterium]